MTDRRKDEVTFSIHEIIGVICEKKDGWKREVTLTSWNGGQPKIDIRDWSPDHERMSRGLAFSEEEAEKLAQILSERYGADRGGRK